MSAGRTQLCGALLCTALLPSVALAEVDLEVRTDRTNLSLQERLTLRISVQSQGTEAAEVSVPDFEGFQIVSQQVQRPMQFSFSLGAGASVQSSIIYVFGLQPMREGVLTIGAIRAQLDGDIKTSQPIQITITGASGQPTPTDQPPASASLSPPSDQATDSAQIDEAAFLRTVVDNNAPYEGEQVTVTIYLYMRERLQAAPEIQTEPSTDGLWVHDLLSPARTLQPNRQSVSGTVYTAYVLRRFAAFPLRSGEITLGPMAVALDTSSPFDIFRGRTGEQITRAGQPVTLNVKPLPADGRPAGPIAIGRFLLNAKLDRPQGVTGDALTLTATVQGEGNLRSTALALPTHPNLDVLEPEIKDLITSPNDIVGGTREYRFLLVPRAPGHFTLPPLVLHTFDPRNQRYQSLASQALTFEVVGQAIAATKSADEPATASNQGSVEPEHKWAPIRTQSALKRNYRPLVSEAFFPWALFAPLLCWFLIVGGALATHRLSNRTLSDGARAERAAEEHMKAADAAAQRGEASRFHIEASAALLAILEARTQEKVSGLTKDQLRGLLSARGVAPGLSDAVLSALERSEFARFGSPTAETGALADELAGTRDLLKRLQAITTERAA